MKLQNYLFKIAEKKGTFWAVFFLTVCESIFLFIPTEIFMTPPIIAKKENAPRIVLAASLGSVAGGLIAYLIGMFLFDTLGVWLIDTFSSPEQFEAARGLFMKHGMLIILATAFTPVPYKLMTLTAGFLGYNPVVFLGLCAVFRTGRFAIAGYLLWRFQEQANKIAKKYFWPLTIAAIAAAVLGICLVGLF
ncbi:MAG: VTT domain-containing protein [Rickettsiales bacterium]|jgi:membrane protein YqaA with SNARE-associated domain|nr:VTT domain-containing protein [Rickettsiales bacterium]